jgi:hypothetical protein
MLAAGGSATVTFKYERTYSNTVIKLLTSDSSIFQTIQRLFFPRMELGATFIIYLSKRRENSTSKAHSRQLHWTIDNTSPTLYKRC